MEFFKMFVRQLTPFMSSENNQITLKISKAIKTNTHDDFGGTGGSFLGHFQMEGGFIGGGEGGVRHASLQCLFEAN